VGRSLAQYAYSLTAVAAALALRWLLDPVLGDRLPFVTLFIVLLPLILLVRPGAFLAGAMLGLVGSWYLFIPPRFSFRIAGPAVWEQVGIFAVAVLTATLTTWLSARQQRRVRDAETLAFESTERLRIELASKVTELETLFAATPTPIWVSLNPQCTRITGNRAANDILGSTPGASLSPSAPPAERYSYRFLRDGVEIAPDMLPMQRAAREGITIEGEEYEIVRGDGKRMWLRMYAAPLLEGGQVRGAVASAVDITDRKTVEQALVEADRRKDEFLATLSHELRNPLAPIRNALGILRYKPPVDAEAQWSRDVIDRQVQVMARLLDDLLDVSRITRGRLELRRECVGLGSVVKGAVETSGPVIDKAGLKLHLELEAEPAYIHADPIRLAQVLSNLLINAAKYTDRGGSIRLSSQRDGDHVVISVKDTGIGIAPQMLGRVFEMFSQARPALKRAQGGLGIGLSLVRGLVQLHGGTIEARSDGAGKGSEFVIRLPTVAAPSVRPAKPVAAAPPPNATPWKCKVLVAEDNADSAETLASLLRLEGHETYVVKDGRRAVEQARKARPDVALVDIGLPEMNGYEVAQHVRSQPWGGQIVLVAVTGWGQEEDKRRAEEAGFDQHLVKPVNPQFLLQLLRDLCPKPQPGDGGKPETPQPTGPG
jgi:signal transduction histidine kinase/ActR/RegA family two-component response regulator